MIAALTFNGLDWWLVALLGAALLIPFSWLAWGNLRSGSPTSLWALAALAAGRLSHRIRFRCPGFA